VLYYLHGDHLGSTSLTTDKDGVIVAQSRYLPYGQERWITGTLTTDFGFTGQRADTGKYSYKHLDASIRNTHICRGSRPSCSGDCIKSRYSFYCCAKCKYSCSLGATILQ
jgi:hypothetical protein